MPLNKIMLVSALCLLGMVAPLKSNAQNILLDEEVSVDSTEENYGKNHKHWVSTVFGGGFFIGPSSGTVSSPFVQPSTFRSGEGVIGLFYKRKWNEYLSTVLSLDYVYRNSARNRTDDTMLYEHRMNFLSAGLHQRFNFKKRGNQYGFYTEIGINGEMAVGESLHIRHRQLEGEEVYRRKVLAVKGLDNLNPFNYNLMAKVGYNGFAFYGRYRMQPLVKEDRNFQYPVWTAGLLWDLSF